MLRRSLTRLLALALLAPAAALSGCGASTAPAARSPGAAPPPGAGALVASSLQALRHSSAASAHYVLRLDVHAVAAPGASASVHRFTDHPLSLQVSGDTSARTLTANAQLQLAGQTITAQAEVGPPGLYVQLLGEWYGERSDPLKRLAQEERELNQRARKLLPGAKRPSTAITSSHLLALVRRYTATVLSTEVTAGSLAGQPTWRLSGQPSVSGILGLVRSMSQTPTASDMRALREYAPAVGVTLVVNRSNRLPRLLTLSLQLDRTQLHGISKSLSALDVTLSLRLSRYGTPVAFTPPATYAPLSKLSASGLGLLDRSLGSPA